MTIHMVVVKVRPVSDAQVLAHRGGKPALGLKTRKKNKQSNKYIVRRRDGKALSK